MSPDARKYLKETCSLKPSTQFGPADLLLSESGSRSLGFGRSSRCSLTLLVFDAVCLVQHMSNDAALRKWGRVVSVGMHGCRRGTCGGK